MGKKQNPTPLAQRPYSATPRVRGAVEEAGMSLLFAIEASKPDGTVYRMLFGWKFYPLASWFTRIAGLL